jgi:hypothetical protein
MRVVRKQARKRPLYDIARPYQPGGSYVVQTGDPAQR